MLKLLNSQLRQPYWINTQIFSPSAHSTNACFCQNFKTRHKSIHEQTMALHAPSFITRMQ